jgi:hypothetical protein
MKIFLLQPASKALWDRIQKNKLNIELTGFYKIVNGITASNYNNFQYKMRLEVTPLRSRIWLIKRQNDSVPVSYTYSVNDYEFDSFTPSTFLITLILGILPRSDSIMISDNLKISVEEFGAMANRIPAQLRVMKQSKAVIIRLIMVRQIVKT